MPVRVFVVFTVIGLIFAGGGVAAQIPQKTVIINKDHLRGTEAGKKYADLSKDMREIRNSAKNFKPGSAPHTALMSGLDDLKEERRKIGEKLRAVLGTTVVLHGAKATRRPDRAVRISANRLMRTKGMKKIRTVHTWYSEPKKKLRTSRSPPKPSEFADGSVVVPRVSDRQAPPPRTVPRSRRSFGTGEACTTRGKRGRIVCDDTLFGQPANCTCEAW